MKCPLFIPFFYLFLSSFFSGRGQNDFKFLPDDARIVECIYGLNSSHSPPIPTRFFEYYVQGDTLINGDFYQLLGTKNLAVQGENYLKFTNEDFKGFAAIRRDSTKVYFRLLEKVPNSIVYPFDSIGHLNHAAINSFPLNEDKLLYDFNMDHIESQEWASRFTSIPTIDTVSMKNGIKKLRYMFYDGDAARDPYRSDFWIEDIGSSKGLLGNYTFLSIEKIHVLVHFCSDEFSYQYFKPDTINQYINCYPKEIPAPEKKPTVEEKDRINIYPNPSKGLFVIKNESDKIINRIVIFNSFGQVVQVRGPNRLPTSGLPLISLTKAQEGLYFIRLYFEDGTKMIKRLVLI